MTRETKRPLIWEYILISIVIMLTGFEFFYRNVDLVFFLLGPVAIIIFYRRKLNTSIQSIIFISVILALSVFQSLYFNNDSSIFIIATVKFIIYMLVASIIKGNFGYVYVRIMYFICLVSLAFYVLINLSPSFYSFLISISNGIKPLSLNSEILSSNPSNTLIIYTLPHDLIYRNCGPFWEPGMFGVFIALAFIISFHYLGLKNKMTIVFMLTALSTLSTSTIITLSVILLYKIIASKISITKIFLMILLPVILIQIINLPFVGDKINSDFKGRDKAYSRIGAMYLHVQQIQDSPIIGYGVNTAKDQERRIQAIEVSPNGLTNIIRVYGIPFSILYFILLFKFCRDFLVGNTKLFTFFVFISLLTLSFSQDITTRHFFYILIFFPLVNINKRKIWT